jgi:small subunit ribosomal protein S18
MAKQPNRSKRRGKSGPPSPRKRRPQLSLEELDWKNFPVLRRFTSERGKIRSRRITGLSRRQQSQVARAVKRAREMGLFAYPDQDRKIRH